MPTPSPASPLSLGTTPPVDSLSDQDLMHLAVYGETPVRRDAAIRAFARREFAKGMRAANQVHSFMTDALVGAMRR